MLSRNTCLEIISSPGDLQIIITEQVQSHHFIACFFRGKGGSFKPLLTLQGYESHEKAVEGVRDLLDAVEKEAQRQNFQSKTFEPDLIQRILEELRQNHLVSTECLVETAN